ncbi:MAG TPA: zf-HC2 domain-containing protein [Bryobacteraceae bacterium]|nr:zf-HC2 domain-containing protein [Bryobacteraceae bacterium]
MPYSFGPHIEPDRLERYSMGQLSEMEIASVEEHLLVCAGCRADLEQMDEFVAAARQALADIPRKAQLDLPLENFPKHHGWSVGKAILIAAVLILTAAPFSLWRPFWNTPIHQQVLLQANRGPDTPQVSPGYLDLRLATPGLTEPGSYQVQLINSTGSPLWSGIGALHRGEVTAAVTSVVSSGQYWVRLFANGQLIREYGLAVR